MSGRPHSSFDDAGPSGAAPPVPPRSVSRRPADEEPDPSVRSREAFDAGVWAALDLCRYHQQAAEKYNPFEAFEERIILLALRLTRGNQYRAAKLLGISRSTLRKRMKKHGILIGVKVVDGA